MTFKLPQLPYPKDALQPHISEETMSFHYGKHHQAYVDKLNDAVAGTEFASMSLEEIIAKTADDEDNVSIFNNAAQTWNHTFFWSSMSPDGGSPNGELARQIDTDFGSFGKLRSKFLQKGQGQFGSGWVWLVLENGKLSVVSTSNANTPLPRGRQPLLTCDVWEHAYYLDYQNQRAKFLEAFFDDLANWSFANENFAQQGEGSSTAARRYQDAQSDFADSGKVEQAAQAARQALDGPEGEELEAARKKASGSA